MPIRIVRMGEETPPPVANYLAEMKHVRQYCMERYGVHSGLKETKDLIDSVARQQYGTSDRAALNAIADAFRRIDSDHGSGSDFASIREALRLAGFDMGHSA